MAQGTMHTERMGRRVRPMSEGAERTAERRAAQAEARQARRAERRAAQAERRRFAAEAVEVDA